MIIADQKNTVERFGNLQDETAFTIKASAHTFRILAKNLYSNPILAGIRESVTNSIDSHLDAGKNQVPVEVHLPNNLEPYFSVKDFGIGMSHEFMCNEYAQAFNSSKNGSNNTMGGIGIGRMSLLAYTDSNFSVTSIHNGLKSSYNVFYNEHGIPTITLLDQTSTTEQNGVEVSSPVNYSDFVQFRDTARRFFRHVSPKPVVKGAADFVHEATEVVFEGKGWKVVKNIISGAQALMGIISYPINVPNNLLNNKQKHLESLSIEIDFGIGELAIAPSREALSYDKGTVEKIKIRFDDIIKEIQEIFNLRFQNCDNLWSAKVLYQKLVSGEYSRFKNLMDSIDIIWRGQKIDLKGMAISKEASGQVCNINYKGSLKRTYITEIPIKENISIYINDLNSGTVSRVRKHLKDNGGDIYVIDLFCNNNEKDLALSLGMDADTDFHKISQLPKVIRAKSVASEIGRAQALLLDLEMAAKYLPNQECWDIDEDFDLENGGIFVPIERNKIEGSEVPIYFHEKIQPLELMGIDIKNLEIYGFKGKLIDKIDKSDSLKKKWVRFRDFSKKKIEEALVADSKLVEILGLYPSFLQFDNENNVWNLEKLIETKENNEFSRFLEKYHSLSKEIEKSRAKEILTLIHIYNISLPKSSYCSLKKEYQDLLNKYPMIKMVLATLKEYDIPKNAKLEISNYIKLCP